MLRICLLSLASIIVFLVVSLWKTYHDNVSSVLEDKDLGSGANKAVTSNSVATTRQGANHRCGDSAQPFPALVRVEDANVSTYIDKRIFIPNPGNRKVWTPCDKEQAAAFHGQSPKLILYGDSITEAWTGKVKCHSSNPVLKGNVETFKESFVDSYGPTKVFAIAGDTSSRLLWRLRNHSEISSRPQAIILHIGINDIRHLGAGCYVKPQRTCFRPESDFGDVDVRMVFASIQAVIKELWQKHCQPAILLSLLFPTGSKWPYNPFGRVVPEVNRLLVNFETTYGASLNFHTVNCSWIVLNTETGRIDKEIMTDYLHPSVKAMKRWVSCIKQKLDTLMPS